MTNTPSAETLQAQTLDKPVDVSLKTLFFNEDYYSL